MLNGHLIAAWIINQRRGMIYDEDQRYQIDLISFSSPPSIWGNERCIISFPSEPPSAVAKRLARCFACGRCRVQIPGPPDLMSHITDKATAGSVLTPQYTYYLSSAPILTISIQNLSVTVAEKARKPQQPAHHLQIEPQILRLAQDTTFVLFVVYVSERKDDDDKEETNNDLKVIARWMIFRSHASLRTGSSGFGHARSTRRTEKKPSRGATSVGCLDWCRFTNAVFNPFDLTES
ncbi:hypothetical protein GEV33_011063 [Tenebrio molitor]|uniref:Uncharacterized protein n=1 Tax=Tenebrio molitor TaxID=7067 RepID=A0A8J6HDK0_TENMO|nr:hypothetical protein GEV33_011063 [Tenebrio molitor]